LHWKLLLLSQPEPIGPDAATKAQQHTGWANAQDREGTVMTRFGFKIKTRSGQRVDNICIMAANRQDAERRLRQMYHHCEIVACNSEAVRRSEPLDLEGVIGMISNDPATVSGVARSTLRNKSGIH
jgi:hypothetical protein